MFNRILATMFISAALLGASNSFAKLRAPILVGQGAGQSEYAIVFTYQSLPALLSGCLIADCGLDDQGLAVLNELIARAQRMKVTVLFKTSVELQSHVFGLSPDGSTVSFNQDLLWIDRDKTQGYDLPRAVGLWIDVLAFREPRIPHAVYERVLVATVKNLGHTLIQSRIEKNGSTFEGMIWKQPQGQDRVFVRDGAYNNYDFTSAFTQSGVLCFTGPASDVRVHGARWAWVNPREDGGLRLGLELTMNWKCSDGAHRGRTKLVLTAQPAGGAYEIDENSSEVYVEGE